MSAISSNTGDPPRGATRRAYRRLDFAWVGLVPFLAFTAFFLIGPVLYLVVGAFQNPNGDYTFANIVNLFSPQILRAYQLSLEISFASAVTGTVAGFLLAYAIVHGGLPKWIRPAVATFSGVASNFAGIPLAFAFIATLGRIGMVTSFLRETLGINIYAMGFNLFSFWGLTLTYLYFQLALMVLIITPAVDGLKSEWREAASMLGASSMQYWRKVALPVLMPSIMGCFLLLFANAFGTIATAYALTGSQLNIVPILLFAQIRGNVLYNPNLGYALAFGMIVITALSNVLYLVLRARAERWQR
ncbi:ABC transporter permease [Pararhizobium mangrovi]|uniref:ABC transporter permease subunit n=1 Tax=Pararhizobium mangrovi TaxID=2590452 RepID=A0A506UEU8_9HYPH|nr:ABC transporter permease subunit [Pararhizobium mangrovi]TPW30287.1 ABC transporter permease subunit [Pararhizobium mangrovi]